MWYAATSTPRAVRSFRPRARRVTRGVSGEGGRQLANSLRDSELVQDRRSQPVTMARTSPTAALSAGTTRSSSTPAAGGSVGERVTRDLDVAAPSRERRADAVVEVLPAAADVPLLGPDRSSRDLRLSVRQQNVWAATATWAASRPRRERVRRVKAEPDVPTVMCPDRSPVLQLRGLRAPRSDAGRSGCHGQPNPHISNAARSRLRPFDDARQQPSVRSSGSAAAPSSSPIRARPR